MPDPGNFWYHATFSTYNSWLPGDPRGFRSRDHRIHSSGDHRNPPLKGEHAGLHRYAKSISGEPVLLDDFARAIAGNAIVKNLISHRHPTLVVAVGGHHVHLLAQLSESKTVAKEVIRSAKISSSMKLKAQLPGQVWSRGCNLKTVVDEEHQQNTFTYIERHRGEGAWVWTFRDGQGESASATH